MAYVLKPVECLIRKLVFLAMLLHILHKRRKDRLELLKRRRHDGQLLVMAYDKTGCRVGEANNRTTPLEFFSYWALDSR